MSDANEINWEDYEAITKYIYESIGTQYGVKVRGYGNKFKVKGKSGIMHQIDVLTEQSVGGRELLTAIECKYVNKKVNKDVVMKLSKVMEDSDIGSGIIVCKTGFTRDTLIFAEHTGTKLVELKEIDEGNADFGKDIEIASLDIHMDITVSRANVTCIILGDKIIVDDRPIMSMYYTNLYDYEGSVIPFGRFLSAFSEELGNREELLKTATIDFPLNRKLYWTLESEVIGFENVVITGYYTKSDRSTTKSFTLTDQVWMIMNELFDKRTFSLSKNGVMWHVS